MTTRVVTTKAQLKAALEAKTDEIIIQNPTLAKHVRLVKAASRGALLAAIASAGIAVTNAWNPLGWGAGVVGVVSGGTLITALVMLGLGAALVWIIYNDYSIETGAAYEFTDKDGQKHKASADVKLKRNKNSKKGKGSVDPASV